MILMSLSHAKPDWTVRTRSREERWGYVLRASVGPTGQTPSLALPVVESFHKRAAAKGYEVSDFDLAAVLRNVEFGREKDGMRVISVAVKKALQAETRAAATALLDDLAASESLTPATRWACGLTVGRASAWLGFRLVDARRPIDDFAVDGAPEPTVPVDADSVWRCLTLLDTVPGAREQFDRLRALAADGWRTTDGPRFDEWALDMTHAFRHAVDWTPYLLRWDAIEAAVRRARAAYDVDPDGAETTQAYGIADDLVKRHHAREDQVVATMPDGMSMSVSLDDFRSFVRGKDGELPPVENLRDVLDKLNAGRKPGDPFWSLDLA